MNTIMISIAKDLAFSKLRSLRRSCLIERVAVESLLQGQRLERFARITACALAMILLLSIPAGAVFPVSEYESGAGESMSMSQIPDEAYASSPFASGELEVSFLSPIALPYEDYASSPYAAEQPEFVFLSSIALPLSSGAFELGAGAGDIVSASQVIVDVADNDAVDFSGGSVESDHIDLGISDDPTASTGRFIWPTEGTLTSKFGPRSGSVGSRNHKGIDIAGPRGTPIHAADGGLVILSERSSSFGNYIKILHDNEYVTLYAHCDSMLVMVGERVAQGQLIALMGRTGIADGVHLHLELIIDGVNVNPLPYLQP